MDIHDVQLGGAIALGAPSGVSGLGFATWLISVLYGSPLLNLSRGASTRVLVLVSLQSSTLTHSFLDQSEHFAYMFLLFGFLFSKCIVANMGSPALNI